MYRSWVEQLKVLSTRQEANRIWRAARTTVLAAKLLRPYSAVNLDWFLQNTGRDHWVPVYDMIANPDKFSKLARRCYIKHLNALFEAAENLVPANASLPTQLTTIAEEAGALDPASSDSCGVGNLWADVASSPDSNTKDWHTAIGQYGVWITASVRRTADVFGDRFQFQGTYYLRDFYDWDITISRRSGLVSPKEMASLHRWGMAREYFNYGNMLLRGTWVEGFRYPLP
jgi:hypothetical protein